MYTVRRWKSEKNVYDKRWCGWWRGAWNCFLLIHHIKGLPWFAAALDSAGNMIPSINNQTLFSGRSKGDQSSHNLPKKYHLNWSSVARCRRRDRGSSPPSGTCAFDLCSLSLKSDISWFLEQPLCPDCSRKGAARKETFKSALSSFEETKLAGTEEEVGKCPTNTCSCVAAAASQQQDLEDCLGGLEVLLSSLHVNMI